MFRRTLIALLTASLAGCAADPATPTRTSTANPVKAPSSRVPEQALPQQTTAARSGAAGAPAAAPVAALPTVPAGARFTIFCQSFGGPDHVRVANEMRNLLAKNTRLKDWYLIHQTDKSLLYHGYYAEIDPTVTDKVAKRDSERSKDDLKMVQSIPNPQAPDRKLFGGSLLLPLDAPDPDAPPAWNLTNAQGFWSVQVAAYTGADRKRETVDSVRRAREMNIPAYYYHGPNVSSVCIGAWERGAVKEQAVGVAGQIGSDPKARDEGTFVVDMTGNDESVKPQIGADGKPMRVLKAQIQVLDDTLMKTLTDYPAQAVDGQEVALKGTDKSGKTVTRTRPSMIVMIPRGEQLNTAEASQTNEPAPTLINPNARSSDLGSRLRGIGQ